MPLCAAELWVINTGNDVRRYDAGTGPFLGLAGNVFRPGGIDVGPDGALLAASFGFSRLYRIEAGNGAVTEGPQVALRPLNPRLGPDGLLYVNFVDGVVQRYNPVTLAAVGGPFLDDDAPRDIRFGPEDRKSTRLNSSHGYISYAVFCLKKKISRSSFHPITR